MSPFYFDNNASTPLAKEVIKTCTDELNHYGNPSSIHLAGRDAKNRLTKARRSISSHLSVSPSEIFFTSGGTESMNLLIHGLLEKKRHKGRIITSSLEHPCVHTLLLDYEQKGWEVIFLSPKNFGGITRADVEAHLDEECALITLMAVNNESGVKNEWQEIAQLSALKKIPFIVDGVALLGKEPFTIPSGVTAMGFSGHKVHAPKGVGFTFIRSGTSLNPLIMGGAQEGLKRGGTENMVGIMGLAKGIELLQPDHAHHLKTLRDTFEEELLKNIPNIEINGVNAPRISNTSNIAFHGLDGESLLINLDLAGIYASHGSACSSGSIEPSRVLLNMGYPRPHVRSSIRFSFNRLNSLEEIYRATEIIIDIVQKMRNI